MDTKDEKPLAIPKNSPPVDYLIIGITKIDAAYIMAIIVFGAGWEAERKYHYWAGSVLPNSCPDSLHLF